MHIQDFFQNFLKLFLVRLHGDCTISLIAQDMSPIFSLSLDRFRLTLVTSLSGVFSLPRRTREPRNGQGKKGSRKAPKGFRLVLVQ